VLRPGGRLAIADIISEQPLTVPAGCPSPRKEEPRSHPTTQYGRPAERRPIKGQGQSGRRHHRWLCDGRGPSGLASAGPRTSGRSPEGTPLPDAASGFVSRGGMCGRLDAGRGFTVEPGDVVVIGPGHDARPWAPTPASSSDRGPGVREAATSPYWARTASAGCGSAHGTSRGRRVSSRRSLRRWQLDGIALAASRRTTSGTRTVPMPCPSKSTAIVTRERVSPSGGTVTSTRGTDRPVDAADCPARGRLHLGDDGRGGAVGTTDVSGHRAVRPDDGAPGFPFRRRRRHAATRGTGWGR
jgi:hypothetical protein